MLAYVPDQQLIINTSCPDKYKCVTWASIVELLSIWFSSDKKEEVLLSNLRKLHIAARVKGPFPHNFRACVIYAAA